MQYPLLRLAYLAASGLAVLAGCKHLGDSSQVKLKDGLPQLLNLSADPEMAKKVCTEQVMFTFVGNAESLGEVQFVPKLAPLFGDALIANWKIAENHRKVEYHEYVKGQLKLLVNALAKVEAGCLNNADVVNAWRQSNSYASITLFTILDGPNVILNKTTHAYEDVAQDSLIMSWRFHFAPGDGDKPAWVIDAPIYWTLQGTAIVPTPPQASTPLSSAGLAAALDSLDHPESWPVQQEFFMPDAVDALLAQIKNPDFLQQYAGTANISRYIYVMKGHGGLVSPYESLDTQVLGAVNDAQAGQIKKGSVFLFDPHGPSGSVTTTDFYSPLWDPEAVCRAEHRGETLGAVLQCQDDIRLSSYELAKKAVQADGLAAQAVVDPLVGKLTASVSGFDQPQQQDMTRPPRPIVFSQMIAQGTPTDPGQGTPTDPGQGAPTGSGQGDPTGSGQGAPTGSGQGDPTGSGQGAPTGSGQGDPTGSGQGDPTGSGQGDPTGSGQGDPTGSGQGSPTEGQGLDGLTLGEGFWRGGAQGAKNLVASSRAQIYGRAIVNSANYSHPLQKAMVDGDQRDPVNGRLLEGIVRGTSWPMAYRFMGKAKAISQLQLGDPMQLSGSDATSLVIFDTCYANMAPFELNKAVPWTHVAGNRPTKWVVLANPIPVLEDALNYGLLTGFQYSYLTQLLETGIPATAGPKSAAPARAPDAIPPPIGPSGQVVTSQPATPPSPATDASGANLADDTAADPATAAAAPQRDAAAQAIAILAGDDSSGNVVDDGIRKRRLHAFLFNCAATGGCDVVTATSQIAAYDQLAHIIDALIPLISNFITQNDQSPNWHDLRMTQGLGDYGDNLAVVTEYWLAHDKTVTADKASMARMALQIIQRLPRLAYSEPRDEAVRMIGLKKLLFYYARAGVNLSKFRASSTPEPLLLRASVFQIGILHYLYTAMQFLQMGNPKLFAHNYDEAHMTPAPYRPVSAMLQALTTADAPELKAIAPTAQQLADIKATEQSEDLGKQFTLLVQYINDRWKADP